MIPISKEQYEEIMRILDRLDRQLQAARSIPLEGFRMVTNPLGNPFTFRIGDFMISEMVTESENRLRSETSGVLGPG